MSKKIVPDIFQIRKYDFKIFEKTILAKKLVPGIFGLVSMVF